MRILDIVLAYDYEKALNCPFRRIALDTIQPAGSLTRMLQRYPWKSTNLSTASIISASPVILFRMDKTLVLFMYSNIKFFRFDLSSPQHSNSMLRDQKPSQGKSSLTAAFKRRRLLCLISQSLLRALSMACSSTLLKGLCTFISFF